MRNTEHSRNIRCHPKTATAIEEKAGQALDLKYRWTFHGTLRALPFGRRYLAWSHGEGFRASGRADGPDIDKVVRQPYRAVRCLGDRGRPNGKCARRFKS